MGVGGIGPSGQHQQIGRAFLYHGQDIAFVGET